MGAGQSASPEGGGHCGGGRRVARATDAANAREEGGWCVGGRRPLNCCRVAAAGVREEGEEWVMGQLREAGERHGWTFSFLF